MANTKSNSSPALAAHNGQAVKKARVLRDFPPAPRPALNIPTAARKMALSSNAREDMVGYAARHNFRAGEQHGGRMSLWALGLTLGGHCYTRRRGGEFEVLPGDLLLARGGACHNWRVPAQAEAGHAASESHWETVWALFQPRPHWHEWLHYPQAEVAPGIMRHHLSDAAFRRMRVVLGAALRAFQSGDSGDMPARSWFWFMLHLERALLLLWEECHGEREAADRRVAAACEFIHAHFSEPLTLAQIAAHSHISVAHLSKLFAEHTGQAPITYLEALRMRHAADLLEHSFYPAGQVGTICGYEDPSYFTKRFRKATGQTPREFRRERRGEAL